MIGAQKHLMIGEKAHNTGVNGEQDFIFVTGDDP